MPNLESATTKCPTLQGAEGTELSSNEDHYRLPVLCQRMPLGTEFGEVMVAGRPTASRVESETATPFLDVGGQARRGARVPAGLR